MPGLIDFDRLRKRAAEDMELTPEQRRAKLRRIRFEAIKKLRPTGGVRGPIGRRKKIPCHCGHTLKHHKKTGRCRRGCDCRAGVRD